MFTFYHIYAPLSSVFPFFHESIQQVICANFSRVPLVEDVFLQNLADFDLIFVRTVKELFDYGRAFAKAFLVDRNTDNIAE